MQRFLEAGAEIQFCVIKVIDCDDSWGFVVHLTFECASVGWVNPITDDGAIFLVDEEHPTIDIQHFFHADIVLRKILFIHLVGKRIEWEEAFSQRFKLPVHIVGPTLCVGAIEPVLAGFEVPETVCSKTVVVSFVVSDFHISLAAIAARVGDRDKIMVGGRREVVGAQESLGFGLLDLLENRRNIWIVDDDVDHHGGVVVVAGGDDATATCLLGDDLDFFSIMEVLETNDFRT